jgi:hypothetical protein
MGDESGPQTVPEKPVDRWLAGAGIAVVIVLALIPKSPISVVGCIAVIFALLFHPIWNFWWIEGANWRRLLAVAGLALGLGGLGRAIWPPEPPQAVHITSVDFLDGKTASDHILFVNVHYTNSTERPVVATQYFAMSLAPNRPEDMTTDVKITKRNAERATASEHPSAALVGPHEGAWTTFTGPHISNEQYSDFRRGKYRLYVVGFVVAKDGDGTTTRASFCLYSEGIPGVHLLCPEIAD